MNASRSDISNVQRPRAAELPLESDVPLHLVRECPTWYGRLNSLSEQAVDIRLTAPRRRNNAGRERVAHRDCVRVVRPLVGEGVRVVMEAFVGSLYGPRLKATVLGR